MPVSSFEFVVTRLRSAGCVFAEAEAGLICSAAQTPDEQERMISARVSGTPLEYVLGWAEFHGIRVMVRPGVFVPRHRSHALIDEAIARTSPGDVVVDLCCGTGALGLAIADVRPGIALYASDLDPVAVQCARSNVGGVGGIVVEGDLFDGLPAELHGGVDVLVVNAPYVPSDDIRLMPAEPRIHENRMALDGGADGLDVHRRVAAEAGQWLATDGHLLVETSIAQAYVLADVFSRNGLTACVLADGEWDGAVVVGARGIVESDRRGQRPGRNAPRACGSGPAERVVGQPPMVEMCDIAVACAPPYDCIA